MPKKETNVQRKLLFYISRDSTDETRMINERKLLALTPQVLVRSLNESTMSQSVSYFH